MSGLRDRFMRKVELSPDGCVNWVGAVSAQGYGIFYLGAACGGATMSAHKAAFIACNGPVPPGMVIDHTCDNKRCVNPQHLVASTYSENIRRSAIARSRARTHCRRGHAAIPENFRSNRGGACRLCKNITERNRVKRAAEAKAGRAGQGTTRGTRTEEAHHPLALLPAIPRA